MLLRRNGQEQCVHLRPSDIFLPGIGDAHPAHPLGDARILVVERDDSI